MKKKLLLLFLLLIPSIVSAKQTFKLEWELENEEEKSLLFSEEKDTYIYAKGDVFDGIERFVSIDKENGEYLDQVLMADELYIYKDVELKERGFVLSVDEETAILNYISQKVDFYSSYPNTPERVYFLEDMDEEDIEDIFGDYAFLYDIVMSPKGEYLTNIREKNDYIIVYYHNYNNLSGIEIYNKNGELIYEETKENNSNDSIAASVYEDKIFVLDITNGIVKLNIYDLEGNKLITKDLTEDINNSPYAGNYYDDEMYAYDIDGVEDGVIINISGRLKHKEKDRAVRIYYSSRLFKYTYAYNVKTKVDGQGKIKVDTTTAASGEGVTFTIEPEEGYVLSAVKVTDANGNVIEFKDYTFTMPSADVTIEAVFELEHKDETQNPLTIDTILIVLPTLLIIGVIVGLMYKKVSWLK
ncbi:MAG: hypothetical protein IKP07_06030 [Bacilli bacterium]|nr:hypothetical protein [Bacilli bacterium]